MVYRHPPPCQAHGGKLVASHSVHSWGPSIAPSPERSSVDPRAQGNSRSHDTCVCVPSRCRARIHVLSRVRKELSHWASSAVVARGPRRPGRIFGIYGVMDPQWTPVRAAGSVILWIGKHEPSGSGVDGSRRLGGREDGGYAYALLACVYRSYLLPLTLRRTAPSTHARA